MLFNDLHGKIQQKNLEKLLDTKLKSVKVGEYISGKELSEYLGNSSISKAISEAKRVDDTHFEITRTIGGLTVVKSKYLIIEKTLIKGINSSVYKIQIPYTSVGLSIPRILPIFYINDDKVLYYDQGKLSYGSTN